MMKRNFRTVWVGSSATGHGTMATAVLRAVKSIQNGRTRTVRTELDLSHDLPTPITVKSPQSALTAGRHEPRSPSMAGWRTLERQAGDDFSDWRLAQHVSGAASRVLHQVDVPHADGTRTWHSRDVESFV